MVTTASPALLEMMTKILAAHIRNNPVAVADLPDFMRTVYRTLQQTSAGGAAEKTQQPAVPVRRSVTPDYIVCLEDGRKLKMLKRHLRTAYDMTPEDYRRRWSLPADYPMVAPNYARQRSGLARKIGLGKRRTA